MSRLINMHVHSALEIALATGVMAAPFVFGLGPAALVTSVVIGAVLMGIALGASGSGRGSIPVRAHAAYDYGIGIGLVGSAVLFGISGDVAALGVLAVAGLLQAALTVTTRYTAPAGA